MLAPALLSPSLAAAHEKSGIGLLLAGLIPIIGLVLIGGLIYYVVRSSRD